MKKKHVILPAAAFILAGLSGCGNNGETAVQDRNTQITQPIGYYSNERHEANRNGKIVNSGDNDGPVVEILDHSLGAETVRQRNGFSRDDQNYHGHLGLNNERKPRTSYYVGYEGELVGNITNTVEGINNVNAARTVIHENAAIIGVVLEDDGQKKRTEAEIIDAVRVYTRDRPTKVLFGESQYNRLKVIDNDLREGGMREQIDLDMDNVLRSIQNR